MSKKDYILIASLLKKLGDVLIPLKLTLVHMAVCLDFSNSLQKENPRFDREKFLKACGTISFDSSSQ